MPKILIVEDEQRLAFFVEKGLQKYGYQTRYARDGVEALAQARSHPFDLMLLDLGLPKLDGWGVISTLRSEQNNLPVIVMTATAESSEVILQAGANAYIAKPFRFKDLLTEIKKELGAP